MRFFFLLWTLFLLILSQAEDDLHEHVHKERCCYKKAETYNNSDHEVYEHLLRLLLIVLLSGYDIGDPYGDAPNCSEDPKQHEQQTLIRTVSRLLILFRHAVAELAQNDGTAAPSPICLCLHLFRLSSIAS